MIPVANPALQYSSYKNEIDDAIHRVLDKGWYILGEEVSVFEKAFADYIGVSYGIGVGSGTEAIHLALASCGIGVGDEVITVSQTAVATVAAIKLAGATPILVDIESDYFTMDPNCLEGAITTKTRAIIPVHLYGQPADMDAIMSIASKYHLYVIEDCSQAHGAVYKNRRVGSIGDMGCFSFYPTKNLGALGDAGMIITDNAKLDYKARLLREYGWGEKRFVSQDVGWNSRLDELQAAVLNVKFKYLENDNSARIKIAQKYQNELDNASVILPVVRRNTKHVFHLYVIRVQSRDKFIEFMHTNGIGTAIHYPLPVHHQPAYIESVENLKETDLITGRIVSLPLYPGLNNADVSAVINAVNSFKR
jgi:dTDP-4-amino-4,6-dideoxygalactose transaminase